MNELGLSTPGGTTASQLLEEAARQMAAGGFSGDGEFVYCIKNSTIILYKTVYSLDVCISSTYMPQIPRN